MKRALLPLLFVAVPAFAGPADYVYTPTVEEGEREIDFKYGRASAPGGHDRAASIGFGYGATSWWFTELYVKGFGAAGQDMKTEAYEWENRFQLTETGKYFVDVGLITELEIPRDSGERKEAKIGALFQREFGRVQANFNTLLERKFGGDFAPGTDPQATVFLYQYQLKYNWKPSLDFGLQGYGETGKWNHWEGAGEQFHNLGPAVFGKTRLNEHLALKYNAAWLFGTTNATPDNTFRAQVELEF